MDNQSSSPCSFREIAYRVFYRPSDNPLESFYLPTLSAAVQYDRSAGYFRSSALAAAAAGIVRLIHNGGRMRLLVGAELTDQDVEAIRQGYDLREAVERSLLAELPGALDGPLKQRLDALTWMVANGNLDIKVVLPLDRDGYPIAGNVAHDYYHTKKGIFTDSEGNQVGFVGSVNESAQAWMNNYEEFQVSVTWEGDRERAAVGQIRISFNDLWEGSERDWVAVDLPEAVRSELIRRAPTAPPEVDPLEPPTVKTIGEEASHDITSPDAVPAAILAAERLRFQFLRDAPFLPTAQALGAATCAIKPWPHQRQVATTLAAKYPDRVMICDEVGLGKTIEAGLLIRQLVISGRVKRCLILAPAPVLRQWQEELYEKFNLLFPRYQQGSLYELGDQPSGPPIADPWNSCDFLIASSHLARRRDRVPQLAAAAPWDLLVVDEAHHARRKDFLQPQYRPNRLLTLLNQLKETHRYQSMLLLTATPMQVHPVEVWDLLTVLGLGGRWGADEHNFLGFFDELRKLPGDTDWDFVFDLVQDYLVNLAGNDAATQDQTIDTHFYTKMATELGYAHANVIRDLPRAGGNRTAIVGQLPQKALPFVNEMARRHTPLRRYVSRNTRDLLRRYVAQGILRENVSTRMPQLRRVRFQSAEDYLYQQITEYITEFYRKYEDERTGLGFIMTVYRRRLTSSFYAVRRSLERRRDWLRGQIGEEEALTTDDISDFDDLEQEELDLDDISENNLGLGVSKVSSGLTPRQKELRRTELRYLDSFITELQSLSHTDSKTGQLIEDLATIFRRRSKVLIFTQYTDTMDYLRSHLQEVYGTAVACYSGRGGEIWNGIKWVEVSKELVKNRFKDGEIKILLCTESASEGLNLQTCGVLINYDMPWNPMRVEQRIGRIDRIGQDYAEVWIYNYFYLDTIEDRIYQALKDRINWFEAVVGNLQPILAGVNDLTRRLAMLPVEEQQAEFEREIRLLRDQVEQASFSALDLDDYVEQGEPQVDNRVPVTLAELERELTTAHATHRLFDPQTGIEGVYWLSWDATKLAVTFRAECFDRYPDSVHFLSYGSPILSAILASVPPVAEFPAHLVRCERDGVFPLRGWYDISSAVPLPLSDLGALMSHLTPQPQVTVGSQDAARSHFLNLANDLYALQEARRAQLVQDEKSTIRAKARRLLEQAALVEIALGRQQGLFNTEGFPTSFSEAAVGNLSRHRSPWSWMLYISGSPLPQPSENDSYWATIQNEASNALRNEFAALTAEAKRISVYRGLF